MSVIISLLKLWTILLLSRGPWTFKAPEQLEVYIERDLCLCSDDSDEYEFVAESANHHVHLWRESHSIYAGEKVVAGNYDYEDGGIIERRDRDYIAAANPAVVLALLDAAAFLDEVRRQVARGALCPMCSTGMTRQTVGMVCQLCGADYARPEQTSKAALAEALAAELRAELDADR